LSRPSPGSENAATHRHDQRSGNTFSGHVGNRDPPVIVVDRYVIIIITTNVARRDVYAGYLKPGNLRSARRQQNPLDITGNIQTPIQPPLFVGLGVDDRVVESKS